ncbi:E3 SUMO-protein ligase RanBP2, partial [Dipsacomyces acuminosporus]
FGAFAKPGASGGFGALSGYKPTFGSSGTAALGMSAKATSGPKGPSAFGVTGQPVFGSSAKLGAQQGSLSFASFGQAGASGGSSIFDAPAQGPSIFDSAGSGKGSTLSSQENPFLAARAAQQEKEKTQATATTTASAAANTGMFGSKAASANKPASVSFGSAAGFGGFGATKPALAPSAKDASSEKTTSAATSSPTITNSSTASPAIGTGHFGQKDRKDIGSMFGTGFSLGSSAKPAEPAEPALPASGLAFGNRTAAGLFGSVSKPAPADESAGVFDRKGVRTRDMAAGSGDVSGNSSGSEMHPTKRWDNKATPLTSPPQETSLKGTFGKPEPTATKSTAAVRQESEAIQKREAQNRREAQRRELEQKSQLLIDNQYAATCNAFDSELKSFYESVKRTKAAISQVRLARLPAIPIDETVQSLASTTARVEPLGIDDSGSWNDIANVLLAALHVSKDELKASRKMVSEQQSSGLKLEAKCEEITRILDSAASVIAEPNSTIDGGLNPLQRDYQYRLKNAFDLISNRVDDVKKVVQAEASHIEGAEAKLPKSLRAPTMDSVMRTLQNLAKTVHQKNGELDGLQSLVDQADSGLSSDQQPLHARSATPLLSSQPGSGSRLKQTLTGSPLRTASSGTPWTPKDNPFSTPAFGRRNRGFGLDAEDLVVGTQSAAKVPGGLDFAAQLSSLTLSPSLKPSQERSPANPHFPHTHVRELVPRSARNNRRASLVSDIKAGSVAHAAGEEDNATVTSAFSNSVAYIQACKQRSLVKDILTRPNRTASLIRTPRSSSSSSYQLGKGQGSAIPEPVPMPNLERYVKAFGELKISGTPSAPKFEEADDDYDKLSDIAPSEGSAVEPESAAESPTPVQPGFGGFAVPKLRDGEWKCSVCDLKNPSAAVKCTVCEAAKPGAQPTAQPAASAETAPSAPTPKGFQPTGGLSFGAANKGVASGFSLMSQGRPSLSFTSFFPPGASAETKPKAKETEAPAEPPAPAQSGFPGFNVPKLKDGEWKCSICDLKNPSTAAKCIVCDAPKPGAPSTPSTQSGPAPPFKAFQPTGGLSLSALNKDVAPRFSSASHGSPSLSFTSFVPPSTAATAEGAADTESAPCTTDKEEPVLSSTNAQAGVEVESGHQTAEEHDSDGYVHVDQPASDASERDEDGSSVVVSDAAEGDELANETGAAKCSAEAAAQDGNKASEAEEKELEDEPAPSLAAATLADDGSEPAKEQDDVPRDISKEDAPADTPAGSDVLPPTTASESTTDAVPGHAVSKSEEAEPKHVETVASDSVDESQAAATGILQSRGGFDADALADIVRGAAIEEVAASALSAIHTNAAEAGTADAHEPAEQSAHGSNAVGADQQAPETGSENPSEDKPATSITTPESYEVLSRPESIVDAATSEHNNSSAALPHTFNVQHLHSTLNDLVLDTAEPECVPVEIPQTEPEAGPESGQDAGQDSNEEVESELESESEAETTATDVIESEQDNAPESEDEVEDESDHEAGSSEIDGSGHKAPAEREPVPAIVPAFATGLNFGASPAFAMQNRSSASSQVPDTKSYFKTGKLGSFGNSSSGVASFGSPTTTPTATSSGGLPNAFSSATAPAPVFGAKLDRPAFGVASMSSYGSNTQQPPTFTSQASGGFASFASKSSGFGARADASINPFAAYRGDSETKEPEQQVSFSSGFRSTLEKQAPATDASAGSKESRIDPIHQLVQENQDEDSDPYESD